MLAVLHLICWLVILPQLHVIIVRTTLTTRLIGASEVLCCITVVECLLLTVRKATGRYIRFVQACFGLVLKQRTISTYKFCGFYRKASPSFIYLAECFQRLESVDDVFP